MARSGKYSWLLLSVVILALGAIPFSARAVVLNWDALTWNEWEGVYSKSFDIDSSNAGVDITVTISGDTDGFAPGNQYPFINNSLTGGLSPVQDGLFLNMNFDDDDDSVVVTVIFHYSQGVNDVSFSLFDVDQLEGEGNGSDFQDKINMVGINLSGGRIAPTDIDDSSANSVTGSGTNRYVYGSGSASDSSSAGNVDYEFGTNILSGVAFRYGNGNEAPNNPGNQWINLHDITYTPRPKVPEWHPGLIASFACMMLVSIRRFFF